jgi:RHS repeat-associated protein
MINLLNTITSHGIANLVAELDHTNGVAATYAWGLDLSGSLHGAGLPRQSAASAGGVGGLLSANFHLPSTNYSCFYAYDGNGNVAALLDAPSSAFLAQYEYGPFAEDLRIDGPLAMTNHFRFSTKYQDNETRLRYYGHRYLLNDRWISRDPIDERGGVNLYAFVGNRSTLRYDINGLTCCGDDITDRLNSTIKDIENKFRFNVPIPLGNKEDKMRKKLCFSVIGRERDVDVANAWDIYELSYPSLYGFDNMATNGVYFVSRFSTGDCEECAYSITFKGKCYNTFSANYAMFGKIMSLCFNAMEGKDKDNFTLAATIGAIAFWKNSRYNEPPWHVNTKQALSFATYGFSGLFPPAPDLKKCEVSRKKVKPENAPFSWNWEPFFKRVPHVVNTEYTWGYMAEGD